MDINEITQDIIKKEDNELAKAFTMVVASLLLSKGIQPIMNKSEVEYSENDDLNQYIIRREYNVTFDIDTTKHDRQIRADERAKVLTEISDAIDRELESSNNSEYKCKDGTEIHTDVGYVYEWWNEYKKILQKGE